MQKTATALILFIVATCALLAIAFGPQAVSDVHAAITIADSRATPCHLIEQHDAATGAWTAQVCGDMTTVAVETTAVETTGEHAVCQTDGECALWDAQGYAMPDTDDATGDDVTYVCPEGMHVYDTENPDLGRSGIVCAPVTAFLPYKEV